MKSIIKFKIKGIDYYTMKRTNVVKNITANGLNFIDKQTKPISVNNGKYTLPSVIITAQEQASEWLSGNSTELDNIINDPKKELHCILNWEVLSIQNIGDDGKTIITAVKEAIKEQPESITDTLALIISSNKQEIDVEFMKNFAHTYEEMKDSLKGLSKHKKISLTLAAMNIGHMAAGNAYNRMSAILEGKDPDEITTKLIS